MVLRFFFIQMPMRAHVRLELKKDEHIILDGGTLGFRKKLTLANQRLIIQKAKGFFKVSWKKEDEIPLKEI